MSKASEWATWIATARDEISAAESKRPEGAWLKLSPGRTLSIAVGNDGNPVIESPLIIQERVEASDLCDFARGILRTFGSGA